MSRKWVINASPIISLAKISQIDLLTELCSNLVIPDGVAEEIRQGENDDPAKIWIESKGEKYIKKSMSIPAIISSWDLGLGETRVLSLCYGSLDYEAVLDDRAAKNCAKLLKIPTRGTLGIILLAKKEDLIKEASPVFYQLVKEGFRISEKVLQKAIFLAGE